MAAVSSRQKALASVQVIFDRYWKLVEKTGYVGFDKQLMSDAALVDASLGPPSASSTVAQPPASSFESSALASATFGLKITPGYCNLNDVMHGGAAGVIFDMMTTCALGPLAKPGYWDFLGGVTRTLNISYLKAVPLGTEVRVHCYVHQAGNQMAYIKGYMTDVEAKKVYCTCEHHKVRVPTKKEHMVPLNGESEEDPLQAAGSRL